MGRALHEINARLGNWGVAVRGDWKAPLQIHAAAGAGRLHCLPHMLPQPTRAGIRNVVEGSPVTLLHEENTRGNCVAGFPIVHTSASRRAGAPFSDARLAGAYRQGH